MNSAFVLCAYFAMVLSPCFVATYGDLLSVRWLFALARRRRTHRAESFRVSVRHERYAMAVALEAAFTSVNSEYFAAPKPFLVPKRSALVETQAFIEGRQRVAARLAQLAVANKLRSAGAPARKIVAIPADVTVDGVHIRPRKPEPLTASFAMAKTAQPVLAEAAYQPTHLVMREPSPQAAPPLRELAEVAVAAGSVRAAYASESSPPLRKPGESDALEIAA